MWPAAPSSSADAGSFGDVIALAGAEGPGSGLGIAYTTDISKGHFTQVNWTAGVPGQSKSPLATENLLENTAPEH